jgi:hypothetical protein
MKKLKEYRVIIIIVLIILGFTFYWFQIRPVSIKKSCSWISEIIPSDNGITREQAEINKIAFEQCKIDNQNNGLSITTPECWLLEKNSNERPPQPEKIEARESTYDEYKSCLRQHGL